MKVTFGCDLDGGAWPDPLADSDAVAGVVVVGPRRFVDLLELHLGLPAPPTDLERAASLAAALRTRPGYWSRSASIDPLGASHRLLTLRDGLAMHGWCGQESSPRLHQLASATSSSASGLADRLAAIVARLRRRPLSWTIDVIGSETDYPRAWRQVLVALGSAGSTISFEPLQWDAMEPGPLSATDIQFLRPDGVASAAYHTAAWIGSDPTRTVLIGRSRILDQALFGLGLPTTGAAVDHSDNLLLEVLPLTLLFAFKPIDPHSALAFLRLPSTPLHRRVADALATSLGEWPAVGGPTWRAALDRAVEEIEEASRGEAARMAMLLFGEDAHRGELLSELRGRVACIRDWAKRYRPDVSDDSPWRAVVEQCRLFETLLQHLGTSGLSAIDVHTLATRATMAVSRFSTRATSGIACVSEPGAILRPVERVVWWSFSSSNVREQLLEVTETERAALGKAGIEIPDRASIVRAAARRWWRALRAASRGILLVCPVRDEAGRLCDPHPALDELLRHVSEDQRRVLEPRERVEVPVREVPVAPRHPPSPKRIWQVPQGRVARRAVESPASVASLLGCSFQWALRYWTPVRSRGVSIPDGPLLYGRLAHELLHRLIETGVFDPESAATAMGAAFDAEGPGFAAPLFVPGTDAVRAFVRSAIVESARKLFQVLNAGRLRVVASEQSLRDSVRALGTDLEGRPDLVLGPRPFVLDFKWSMGGHRAALEHGTALQLAFYAHLAEQGGEQPAEAEIGYFVLRSQQLVTTATLGVEGVWTVTGPRPRAIFDGAKASYLRRIEEVSSGMLVAVANLDRAGSEEAMPEPESASSERQTNAPASALVGGELMLEPPCRYCEYAVLCGLAFEGSQ